MEGGSALYFQRQNHSNVASFTKGAAQKIARRDGDFAGPRLYFANIDLQPMKYVSILSRF